MDQLTSLLTEQETVLQANRVHWIVFTNPMLLIILGVAVCLLFHPIVGSAFFLLAIYPLYIATVRYFTTRLVLTDKKVIACEGFWTKDWTQMMFSKIENYFLEESIPGRVLGYSTVIVSGVGTGSIAIPFIKQGESFTKRLDDILTDKPQQETKA